MKIIKIYNKGIIQTDENIEILDEKAEIISRAFDHVIKRIQIPLKFDKIEFHIDSKNSFRIDNKTLIIKISESN